MQNSGLHRLVKENFGKVVPFSSSTGIVLLIANQLSFMIPKLVFPVLLENDIFALRDLEFIAPMAIRAGEDLTLVCRYDLNNDTLYSIQWYFNHKQFFLHFPSLTPHSRVVPEMHIDVDKKKEKKNNGGEEGKKKEKKKKKKKGKKKKKKEKEKKEKEEKEKEVKKKKKKKEKKKKEEEKKKKKEKEEKEEKKKKQKKEKEKKKKKRKKKKKKEEKKKKN
ncbi:hypothetical protein M8J77_002485 [Diaphorina citri]|nr:hypothetical protein M8J77_002485 [Diaphorina citri]